MGCGPASTAAAPITTPAKGDVVCLADTAGWCETTADQVLHAVADSEAFKNCCCAARPKGEPSASSAGEVKRQSFETSAASTGHPAVLLAPGTASV